MSEREQQHQRHPEPPQPPQVPRKAQLPGSQIAGLILLLILPTLAIAGVFGQSFDTAAASGSEVSLSASYPSRLRFRQDSHLQITVQNTGQQTLTTVAVQVERGYLDAFSKIAFRPAVTEATDSAYVVEVRDLAPGASQAIAVEFQGEKYGRHSGRIWVTIQERTAAEVTLASLVYP